MTGRVGASAVAIAVSALALAACHTEPPVAPPAAASAQGTRRVRASRTDDPLVIRTALIYTRPRLFASAARPIGFGVVRNYRDPSAENVAALPGVWDETTQSLTTDVTITLKSENLVYVDDPTIAPESETPVRAARSGELPEVACPDTVPPQHPCYLLQILR